MAKGDLATVRPQTAAEELANTLSHFVGLLAAIVALPFLISRGLTLGDPAFLVGVSVFGGAMIVLYFCSTLYHFLRPGRAKDVCQIIDHSAIYLLIAGTYTPFTLGALSGPWGWTLFGVVWGLAALGMVLKAFNWLNHSVWSTGLYLLMGWLILVALHPLTRVVPLPGILWLVGGGLAYSLGVVFYVLDSRIRFAHFVWHLFVLTGTLCHYFAILWYAH
ncbi:hemolysin III family protein [Marinimicrobium sp. ABcell2]|uniref:PAQR family membrane homeostasis protein TrhA n=1 Tax=Marinimicrobium sp. ABcell2 TaxID=3069751 RepID=UPI0027B7DAB6|nr:hemolysin III family protein [Marinimicrobium sp. ABcell2]MDQ2075564.1 hemolysin III family protein [Marinimicrobium sp. ABcell2]